MAGGKCTAHQAQQRQRSDQQRGTARQRGYDEQHATTFRQAVLDRDGWTCVLCGGDATVADHYPLSRRELVAQGLDPNHPSAGRSLCGSCHSTHTQLTEGQGKGNLRN